MCVIWLIIHMYEVCLVHLCDMTRFVDGARHLEKVFVRVTWLTYVWHDSFICMRWLIHVCDMTYSFVWPDSFICVTWLIHMFDILIYVCDMAHFLDATPHLVKVFVSVTCLIDTWHDSFIFVTWLIYMFDMTYSFVWHDRLSRCSPPPRVPIHIRDMIRSYVWHELFICVTCLIHMFDMIYSFVWHDSFLIRRAHEWVMPHMNRSCHIWMNHATHMNKSCHIWVNHVTHTIESCYVWISHATHESVLSHMNQSCHT